MEKSIQTEVVRGHVNTIILSALYESDKYGYEIGKHIENKTQGAFKLKEPTLYSSLKRLEKQGLIASYYSDDEEKTGGGRRKYYKLTEKGLDVTSKNLIHWEYSRTLIDRLVSDREFDLSQEPPEFEEPPAPIKKMPRTILSAGDEFNEEARELQEAAQEAAVTVEAPAENEAQAQPEPESLALPSTSPENQRRDSAASATAATIPQEEPQNTEPEPTVLVQTYTGESSVPARTPAAETPQESPEPQANRQESYPAQQSGSTEKKDAEYKRKLDKLYQSAKNSSYTVSLMETKADKATSDYSLLPHRDNQPAKIVFNDEDELKEITEGYTIRQFVPGKNAEFKQQILKNALLRDTLCIFYLFSLALDFLFYFCADHIIRLGFMPYLYAGIALLIFPLYGLVVWIMDTNKRDKAKLSAPALLFNASMIFLYTSLLIIIINLITKTNFNNVSEVLYRVVIPCTIALLPLLGCTIYTLLFHSERYHI